MLRSFCKRFRIEQTLTVVTLVAQRARLQLKESEEQLSHKKTGAAHKATKIGETVSEMLFNTLALNGLSKMYESFLIQESCNPATNFAVLRRRLEYFYESTA